MNFESVSTIKKEEVMGKGQTEQEKKLFSLVSSIKEKFPNLEKVFEKSGKIARLMTVLVTLEGGQLFAQEIQNKDIDAMKQFTIDEVMNKLDTMALSEIEYRLESFKLKIPEGQTKFSQVIKNDSRLEGTDYNNRSCSETVPSDTGMVGDVGIYNTCRSISRHEEIKGSKENDNSYSKESIFTSETKVLDNFKDTKIEKSVDGTPNLPVNFHGRGHTKQDAIMDAIKELNMYVGVNVGSGTVYNKIGSKQNKNEVIEEKTTNYVAMDSMNIFKNLHIDKIEEAKEGGETIYLAYVSAQKGQLVEK